MRAACTESQAAPTNTFYSPHLLSPSASKPSPPCAHSCLSNSQHRKDPREIAFCCGLLCTWAWHRTIATFPIFRPFKLSTTTGAGQRECSQARPPPASLCHHRCARLHRRKCRESPGGLVKPSPEAGFGCLREPTFVNINSRSVELSGTQTHSSTVQYCIGILQILYKY